MPAWSPGASPRSAHDHHRPGPADRGRRQTLGIHDAAGFFITGAIAGAVLLLGIAMMLAGLRRKGARARQHRADRTEARNAGRDKAQEENDELRRRLDRDAGARLSGVTAAD